MSVEMIDWLNPGQRQQFLVALLTSIAVIITLLFVRAWILRKWKNHSFARQHRGLSLLAVFYLGLLTAAQLSPARIRELPALKFGLKAALVILALRVADEVLSTFIRSRGEVFSPSAKGLAYKIGRVILYTLGILVLLESAGVSITPLLASLGVGSIAVALALQDTLSNFFSGVYLLVDRPIRVGDYVKVEKDIEGTVIQIGWRSTHIRHPSNNTFVLPNSKLSSSVIINYDLPDSETAVSVEMETERESDLARVERVVLEVAKEVLGQVEGGVARFSPSIRFTGFAESGVRLSITLRAKRYSDAGMITHEFIKAIAVRFRTEGLRIPYPQRVIQMRSGESPPRGTANP